MFLARKVTRAKWAAKHGLAINEMPADAVTIDLRTQGNSLSFWRCPSDATSDVEEVALAIAASREHLERVDIVWLDDQELQNDGQILTNSKGHTPVKDLIDLHVNVSRLDYVRLGRVARRLATAIEEGRYLRLTRARVKKLIVDAVEQGRIELEALENDVRTEVLP